MDLNRSHASFETTDWTLVRALKDGDAAAADTLVRNFWPPVYGFLRRRGKRREEAGELTADFFANVILGRRLFEVADQRRGRLRSLILRALTNYLRDRHRREVVRGKRVTLPLESLGREDDWITEEAIDAESIYDRRWGLAILQEALRRCESHFRRTNRARHWELFEMHVLLPSTGGQPPSLAAMAGQFGFDKPANAGAAIQVVKERARVLLQQVVLETLDDPSDLESELGDVRRLLSL